MTPFSYLRGSTQASLRGTLALFATRTGVLGLTTIGSLVVRTGSSIILTRLLTPAEFGIVGLITSVFFAVALITDLGFQDFLVRHERTEDRWFRDVIWSIHATRGLAIFVLIAGLSPLIAWMFDKPQVATPLAVASLIFAINGVSSLSLITALRNDRARELSLLEFGLQCFQTAACVLLALWWQNAWSIVVAMVLQSALRALLSYWVFPDSSQGFARDRAIALEFLNFSSFIMVSSALTMVLGQTDKIVLGRIFSLSEFGLYSIALTIVTAPLSFAESYVNRIVFPICSQTWRRSPSEIARVYYSVRRLSAGLYAFACGGLMGSAMLLVALLYDTRYAPAARFVSLLMIATALRLPNIAAAQLMVAVGQVQKTMQLVIVRLVWVIVTIPAGLAVFGPIGVVAAIGLIEVPAMIYSWFLLRRYHILNIKEELAFVGLVIAGALIGWLVSTQTLRLLPQL